LKWIIDFDLERETEIIVGGRLIVVSNPTCLCDADLSSRLSSFVVAGCIIGGFAGIDTVRIN